MLTLPLRVLRGDLRAVKRKSDHVTALQRNLLEMPPRNPERMSELKLKKLLDANNRLRAQLEMPRISVSQASASLLEFCNSTRDTLVPSVWGPVDKRDDPYAPIGGGCCTVL